LYYVWLTQADPVWKAVLAQFGNAGVYSPPPFDLVILLGPAFLLAIFALVRLKPWNLSSLPNGELFLTGWFLSYFAIIYLPVDFQVHLINGWQVPIALLATLTLFRDVIPWASRRFKVTGNLAEMRLRNGIAAALIVLILPTNLYLWAWRFYDLSRHDYLLRSTGDEQAFRWWTQRRA
jgi:hypothetical protein